MLCDEPLSNLDADLRERMRVEISSLVREAGATTVYITHDQAEAFALADRVGVLEAGRLVQLGTPEEIYTRPATPFVARFTGLSGEFPVRVRDTADDGTSRWNRPGPASPAVPRPPPARADAQPAGLLLIRPTGVRLSTGQDGEHTPERDCGRRRVPRPGLRARHRCARARAAHRGLRRHPRGAGRACRAPARAGGCHVFAAGPAWLEGGQPGRAAQH